MGVHREFLRQLPALTPPPGVEANFDDPDNLRGTSLARNIAVIIISSLAVCMRLFTKYKIVRKLHLEDYFIFISWINLVLAIEIPALMLQKHKLGAHQWDMTVGEMISQLYYFHFTNTFYCIGTLFLKAAINIQCLRIFCLNTSSQAATYLLRILLWVNIILYLVSAGLVGFPCRPIRKAWDVTVEGHCINRYVTAFIMAIMNTVSDLLLVVIPLKALWVVSWDMKRKLRVSALFAIGLGACICAITRIAPSWLLYRSDDKTYYLELNGGLGILEYFFGLCAACFPVLLKFVSYLVDDGSIAMAGNPKDQLPDRNLNQCENGFKREQREVITDVEFHGLVNGIDTLNADDDRHLNSEARSADSNIRFAEGSAV